MAWIDNGRIRDRLPGSGRKLCYTLAEGSLARGLEVHQLLVTMMPPAKLATLTSEQAKSLVTHLLGVPKARLLDGVRDALVAAGGARDSEGGDAYPVSEMIQAYLSHAQATTKPSSHYEQGLAAQRWIHFFGLEGVRTCGEITHKLCQQYASIWRPSYRPPGDARMGRPVGSRTISAEIGFMDKALKLARKARLIQYADQCEDVAVPKDSKVVSPLDDAQTYSLIAYLAASPARRTALHVTLALLTTGMRASELARSQRADWIETDGYIQVWTGKTANATRKIPMPVPLGRRLASEGLVFEDRHNLASWLGHIFARAEAELGFRATAHQLRHTCASNWRRADIYDMTTIADFLGHADLSFTRARYSKISNEAGRFPVIRQRYKTLVKWLHDFPIGGAAAEIEKHLSKAA